METPTAARTLALDVCELLPQGLVWLCVYTVSKHTNLGWTRWPSLSTACGPSWESGGHKHSSNTHTHTLSFISTLQMTKHFLAVSTWNFPTSSLRWWMWPESRSVAVCRECFRVLCALCLDCGLLLTSLWLQTLWHLIYGNELWRKLRRINQAQPTCTMCVFGKERW